MGALINVISMLAVAFSVGSFGRPMQHPYPSKIVCVRDGLRVYGWDCVTDRDYPRPHKAG
jgi:hypothetical protein